MRQLWRAIAVRLFAGSSRRPAFSLCVRASAGLALSVGLVWIVLRITPETHASYDYATQGGLVFGTLFVFATLFFILTDGAQRQFLQRLELLHYMSLSQSVIRSAYVVAYLPLVFLAGAIAVPAVCVFFGGGLFSWAIGIASFAMSGASWIITRTIRSSWEGYCLCNALLWVAATLPLVWGLLWLPSRIDVVLYQATLGTIALAQAVLVGCMCQLSVRSNYVSGQRVRYEWKQLALAKSFVIRALRTSRYVSANGIIMALFVGLSAVAYSAITQAIPFDGIVVATLVLVGTLGQEVRSLSPRRYATELICYGLFTRWWFATYQLACVNAVLYITMVCVVAAAFFPHALSVGTVQAICAGLGLLALGITVGSIVVPQKGDMPAQIISTVLYGGLAWVWLRFGIHYPTVRQLMITFGLSGFCLILSYLCEKVRWLITIKGKYAALF